MATKTNTDRDTITETELSECDREPLHHIAQIQGGCGHVLFFEYPKGTIVSTDALIREVPWFRPREQTKPGVKRTREMIDHSEDSQPAGAKETNGVEQAIIGSLLQSWIPDKLHTDIFKLVDDMNESQSKRVFHFYIKGDMQYAISVFSADPENSCIGVEIEEVDANEVATSFFTALVQLGRVMETNAYGHEAIAITACEHVFKLLGMYERGMVYRFNDDLSGEVIHEIKKDSVSSSYMGMRFPSSDIPLPARKLYILNGLRYINDVDAEHVPVHSHGRQIDLTHCRMRAVAKPHVVYLRNMGVRCSLSMSIVVDNELWGLLAFHGYSSSYRPSLNRRIACETIVQMMSVRIEGLLKKATSARVVSLGQTLLSLRQDESAIQNLRHWGEKVLESVDADVLVGYTKDPRTEDTESVIMGDKSLAPLDSLWEKLKDHPNRALLTASTRGSLEALGITQEECPAVGIVYFRQDQTRIFLGRTWRSRDVVWAGNPDEPKLRIGGILHPRASFDKFIIKAQQEARSWSAQDLHVISVLRDRICENALNWTLSRVRSDMEDTNHKYLNVINDARRNNYEFFAHMSHELRTPFHGVLGCLNILRDSIGDMEEDEIKDVLNTALSSGDHMMNLLNNILDISKTNYLSEIDRETVSYQNLGTSAIDGMKSLATSRQIQLNFEILPKNFDTKVITDSTKVTQIVSNIINNAIKFTGKGGVKVQFELLGTIQDSVEKWINETSMHSGVTFTMNVGQMLSSPDKVKQHVASLPDIESERWVLISVEDSGCGMKPSDLDDMFSPYTQSSSGSNRIFQGTGLGLFICVALCQNLSGFIACASTPDVGTIFHVGIPVTLHDESTSNMVKDPVKVCSDLPQAIHLAGPILVVDDNLVNVKILHRSIKMVLQKLGHNDHEVLTASGGDEAIAAYKEKQPGLCFIDYHMPETDGIASTIAIRSHEKEKDLDPAYILAYTADVTDVAKRALIESGANSIMTKPSPKGFLADLFSRVIFEKTKS